MSAIVSVQGVRFAYPSRKNSPTFELSVPDFELGAGEQWMLVGPSGSGKSTVLNLIAGELLPQQGRIEVLGQSIQTLDYSARQAFRIAHIGYVFQDFPLVPYLNALQNVVFPYRVNPALLLEQTVFERASTLLEQLGLGAKGARMPNELSQGERQRVAIARALITNPELILADEPTAGLDIDRSHSVMSLLESLATERQVGLLVVSHEPQIVQRFENVLRLEGQ